MVVSILEKTTQNKSNENKTMQQPLPYNQHESKKKQVKKMFDNVSGSYDKLNRLITFGMDLRWRKNLAKIIKSHNPQSILDIATGTGDMPLLFSKTTSAEKIIGIDISEGMLREAKEKINQAGLNQKIEVKLADAENMDFLDNSFDVLTVSYGIRNFENLEKGLSEIFRVLKPGGLLVILETSVPEKSPFKQGYLFYTKRIIPWWGKIIAKDKEAYAYLSNSASNFPYGQRMKVILEKSGFSNVKVLPQSQGISSIYVGGKEEKRKSVLEIDEELLLTRRK